MLVAGLPPRFYLYGEPHRAAESRFAHVESLDDRSRPSEWTIQPHAHAELNHLFHIATGGGAMRAEEASLSFEAPCLIVVPAGLVHGFDWHSDSTGAVLTIATAYLDQLGRCDPALAALFRTAASTALDETESRAFAAGIEGLMRELGWQAPGHRAAVEAGLLSTLVRALRTVETRADVHRLAPGRQAALVARYRERVEARFRLREPVKGHAAALRTSPTRLRAACAAVARQSPTAMLDQRAMVEAQRALLYSNLSIAEIANALGFEDAAYFSRFFRRHAGASPRAYRTAHAPMPGTPSRAAAKPRA